MREALLTRLDTIESIFGRLEPGKLLGSIGGDRTHTAIAFGRAPLGAAPVSAWVRVIANGRAVAA